jgi:hypothetical protein
VPIAESDRLHPAGTYPEALSFRREDGLALPETSVSHDGRNCPRIDHQASLTP